MQTALRKVCPTGYYFCSGLCKRVQIYTSFASENVEPLDEDNRYTTRRITLPGGFDILLVAVHLVSKLHSEPLTQAMNCCQLARTIQRLEEKTVGHNRTLLVGDLNMNPFEEGVVAARSLNAVLSAEIARTNFRRFKKDRYPYFYNPMWSCFGEDSAVGSGTYFYRNSANDVCYYWNAFDQVLVRPALMDYFRLESLKVIDSDGRGSLLSTRRGIRRPQLSDHLPLSFSLNF